MEGELLRTLRNSWKLKRHHFQHVLRIVAGYVLEGRSRFAAYQLNFRASPPIGVILMSGFSNAQPCLAFRFFFTGEEANRGLRRLGGKNSAHRFINFFLRREDHGTCRCR